MQRTITQDHVQGARHKGDPFEDTLERCAKAIAGTADVKIAFEMAQSNEDPIACRVIRRAPEIKDGALAAYRGEVDLAGLFRAHHDPAIHRALVQEAPHFAHGVAAFERARVETIGALAYRGVAANLAAALDERCLRPSFEAERPSLLEEAAAMLIREAFTPGATSRRRYPFVEKRRRLLAPLVAAHVGSLRSHLHQQARFGRAVLSLLSALPRDQIAFGVAEGAAQVPVEGLTKEDPGAIQKDQVSDGEGLALKAPNEAAGDAEPIGEAEPSGAPPRRTSAGAFACPDEQSVHPAPRYARGQPKEAGGYRVFTRRYDRVVTARSLLQLYADIDVPGGEAFAERRKTIRKLAVALRHALLSEQPFEWAKDLADGYLDASRLPRVVTSPLSGRFYRKRREAAFKDTVVTLLLDNSSSMRGEPLAIVGLCADLLAQAMESCGARVEVLGFTTCSWRGGLARQAWIDAGQPRDPGRVSELLHIIYKRADAPVRVLRQSLRLLGARGLHKENVDGEALEWAYRRLLRRPESRRILIVVSDGAPSEETTLSLMQGAGNALEAHLLSVIDEIRRRRCVDLLAVGIKYDVQRLYDQAVRLDEVDDLAETLTREIPRMLRQPALGAAGRAGRGRSRVGRE